MVVMMAVVVVATCRRSAVNAPVIARWWRSVSLAIVDPAAIAVRVVREASAEGTDEGSAHCGHDHEAATFPSRQRDGTTNPGDAREPLLEHKCTFSSHKVREFTNRAMCLRLGQRSDSSRAFP
jgi:hypothetical protein